MTRSRTVTPALVMLLLGFGSLVCCAFLGVTEGHFVSVIFVLAFLSGLRLFFLFWATLHHCTSYEPVADRGKWVTCHHLFGLVASLSYYYKNVER